MVKSNLKEQKVIKKADLKVVDNNAVKTTAYSDINLKKWREYDHIKTDTLWEFPNRLKEGGHSNEYHGNYIPQIAQQIYERYTKKNDIVLDLFFGSGTSGIEAINMGRRCIGVELKDELAESVSEKFTPKQLVTDVNIICADSASEIAKEKIKARLDIMGAKKAQLLMLHPPYDDIIKFSDKKEDLSNCATTEEFYDLFEKEELFGIWQSVNYRMYICNANAPVNQGAAPKSAKSLLKNIIESADRAIREGTPCATLRFGHDTNLIRLLALMQVEGCSNQETDPDRYYLAWQDFRVSPMGANLQLIFFKNKQGEVIVKLLHNENEVKLPIDSPIAPYYKWETVKAFYNHL